ncbi:MAG: phage tail protein [Bacteroidales bacterium]|nr:phage tail protein [Bacteroidales bacterium]
MSALETFRELGDPNPALSHRFGVFFLAGGILPNPIDFRFQKVSGLSTEVQLETINEGGQNLFAHRLPTRANYNNLVLERGYSTSVIPSPLNLDFINTFSRFKFNPSHVFVMLFNETGIPIGSWLFTQAYPVRWSVSDLDAQANSVVIDSMELAYTRFRILRI